MLSATTALIIFSTCITVVILVNAILSGRATRQAREYGVRKDEELQNHRMYVQYFFAILTLTIVIVEFHARINPKSEPWWLHIGIASTALLCLLSALYLNGVRAAKYHKYLVYTGALLLAITTLMGFYALTR